MNPLADRPNAETAKAYRLFARAKHEILFISDLAILIVDEHGKIAWSKIYGLRQKPDAGEALEAARDVA